ncbi:MAG: carbohydrate kinase family protein [Bellilinea sp.]
MIDFKTDKPILSVGDACTDIILPFGETRHMMAAHLQGETNHMGHNAANFFAGGSVANTAHGIAVLGGESWFAGKAGDDFFGRYLQSEFVKAGVDTRFMILDEQIFTSMIIVVVDENQERVNYAIPPHGGSQHLLEKHDLPDTLPDQIGWLHTSGILLRENPAADTILDFMDVCQRKGIPTSLDLNFRIEAIGYAQYVERIQRGIQLTNVLFGSGEEEMMPITSAKTPQAAAKMLVGPNRMVVCRGGAQGADIYLPDGNSLRGNAFDVPVVDTLGAGDAYNAGFIVAATEGHTMEEANRMGNAVSGFKIMHPGARNFPNRLQLEEFLAKYTVRTV